MDRKKGMTEEELLRMREQGKDDLIWRTYSRGATMKDVCFIAETDRERVYTAAVTGIVQRLIQKAERGETGGIGQLEKLKARLDCEMAVLRHEDEEAIMRSRAELAELNRKLEELDRELDEAHTRFSETLDGVREDLDAPADDESSEDTEDTAIDALERETAEEDGDVPETADGYSADEPEKVASVCSRVKGWIRKVFTSDLFAHACLVLGMLIIIGTCIWGVVEAVRPDETALSGPEAEYWMLSDKLGKAISEREDMIAGLSEIGGYIEDLMGLYGDGVEALSAKQAEISFIQSGIDRVIGQR